MKVAGRSMMPALPPGSFVLVFSPGKWTLDVNDVVVFRCPNRGKLVKRVLSVEPNKGYFLGGDNIAESISAAEIGWVPRRQIIGKVIWHSVKSATA
ncbi:S26 family signal peptidase [Alteromonas sp. C1M14]|uniref:S26 family signal peptidase n=1 Tax=Alteromonas sp. C1M14 TaxID=2841567 RepID=UPI001C083DE9|nr:S26 family signal peptidase [Alteromonas sp. C1M14]